jgi:hypothetical protein
VEPKIAATLRAEATLIIATPEPENIATHVVQRLSR